MQQLNLYKKRCYLTDNEKDMIYVFFKSLFKVENITDIHVYLTDGRVIVDIEGYEIPKATSVGSFVQHDNHSPTLLSNIIASEIAFIGRKMKE